MKCYLSIRLFEKTPVKFPSNQFDISLDTLLKKDSKMVQSMDKERAMGIIKHEKSKSDKKVFQYIEQLKNIDIN